MKSEIKLYTHDQKVPLLELSDNHTWWEINNPLVTDDIFDFYVDFYLELVRSHYKDLEIGLYGRSGRHVCIKDTPKNRRRYLAVQKRFLAAEAEMVSCLNALTETEIKNIYNGGNI